ncbi:hypothetical protein NQ317_000428 [Molorchus minor]|uniref:Uncharacterized protein n=1 Tax=Molorchus minor TaxID=1323400 RepID=A0ABQ9JWA1_9CUCU|nr:hypothetical protein NQ317_000428 [Molorchus minor]
MEKEYLKGTVLYFAGSFSARLKLYNFGTLKFIAFLADTVTAICENVTLHTTKRFCNLHSGRQTMEVIPYYTTKPIAAFPFQTGNGNIARVSEQL